MKGYYPFFYHGSENWRYCTENYIDIQGLVTPVPLWLPFSMNMEIRQGLDHCYVHRFSKCGGHVGHWADHPIIRSSDHDEMINGAILTPKHFKIKDQPSHQQPDLCIPKKGGFYQTWLRSHPELVLAVRSDGMLAAPDETLTGSRDEFLTEVIWAPPILVVY